MGGYFPGYTYTPGMMWSASDEQLKQNIEDLPTDEAMNKLQQLTPRRTISIRTSSASCTCPPNTSMG
ncbi:MAG: tail fiber domain-containing protein [Flavobacteriales bacterium]|nr:tail fiber domain-containing protein [Flavobacteriales bacterium]